ncbi:MAG TPA: hypothetical protein VEC93_08935 [Anaerolineae bacterium]|nr:hypothetical protein [Anaerolineae bacterium]
MRQLPFTAGNDAGRSKFASIAKLLNLYVETQSNPNAQIRASLLSCPGSREIFSVPGGTQITGMHPTASSAFFTTRNALYEIRGGHFVKRADIAILGRTCMADNGTSLIIVDGFNMWSYNMESGAVRPINMPPSQSVRFAHGYFIVVDKGTNRQRVSGFYTDVFDDPVNEANCEGSPDNIQAVEVMNGLLFFLGQKTIEPWYLSGEDYPFNPSQAQFIDRGCYGPHSYVLANDCIYWLGDDKIVYRMVGYTPQRISTHSEESVLASADCAGAYMITYSHEGHDFVLLQIPSLNATLCYDCLTGMWHDRKTGSKKHFAGHMLTISGQTYAGAQGSPSVSLLDHSKGNDNGIVMRRQMVTPKDLTTGRVNRCELLLQYFNPPAPEKLKIDMSSSERMVLKEWPIISMAYTDDNGSSWSIEDAVELEPNPEMKAVWNKLGYSYGRSYRFTLDADMPCVWAGGWLE